MTVSGFDFRRRHFISVCNQPPRLTQPSALRGTVKWVAAKGRWCSAAGKVTTGLAESNGSLPPGGWLKSLPASWLPVQRDHLRAQCSVTSMGSLCLSFSASVWLQRREMSTAYWFPVVWRRLQRYRRCIYNRPMNNLCLCISCTKTQASETSLLCK